jgi:hypothetical protein
MGTYRLIYVTTGRFPFPSYRVHPSATANCFIESRRGLSQSRGADIVVRSAVALFQKLGSFPNRCAAQRYRKKGTA